MDAHGCESECEGLPWIVRVIVSKGTTYCSQTEFYLGVMPIELDPPGQAPIHATGTRLTARLLYHGGVHASLPIARRTPSSIKQASVYHISRSLISKAPYSPECRSPTISLGERK